MSARHPDELIDAFLDEGRDDLPDRVFDAVRGEIHLTRQRVVIGPWREPQMSNLAKVALAAAAVIAVLFGASRLLPSTSGPGTSPPSIPSPTATASPTETPADSAGPSMARISPGPICDDPEQAGLLEAGTYAISNEVMTQVPYTLEVPAGWTLSDGCGIGKYPGEGGNPGKDEVLFSIWNVTHIYADACAWDDRTNVISTGSTPAELADALGSQLGNEASAPTDVELDGFAAVQTELTIAPEVDPSTCTNGYIRLWPGPGPDFNAGFCCSPKNEILDLRIVDVNGKRVVILAGRQPQTSAQDVAELNSIVDSINFDTTGASPAP